MKGLETQMLIIKISILHQPEYTALQEFIIIIATIYVTSFHSAELIS